MQLFPSSPQDITRLFANIAAATQPAFAPLLPVMGWPSADIIMFTACTTDTVHETLSYQPGPPAG